MVFLRKLKERGFVMRKHAKQLSTIAEPIKMAMNAIKINQIKNKVDALDESECNYCGLI